MMLKKFGLTQKNTIINVLKTHEIKASDIEAIGITNQRETTIVWNKKTGKPIHKALVWQDRRTADYCETLKLKGLESLIQQKTGLLIDAYFSASKIKWLIGPRRGGPGYWLKLAI